MLKRRLKEPFGKAGLIVGIVALVFAMLGGAYAATGGAGGGKATASAKAKQGKQGKPGKTGPTGPTGPAGAPGKDGTNGTNGTNGTPGSAGESVTVSAASVGECPKGGTKFSNKTGEGKACNGLTGFTKTLPTGESERGAWSVFGQTQVFEGGFNVAIAPISFNIPIAAPIAEVHYVPVGTEEDDDPAGCTGTVAEPGATSGNLCVFAQEEHGQTLLAGAFTNPETGGPFEAGKSGTLLKLLTTTAGSVSYSGVWVVTG